PPTRGCSFTAMDARASAAQFQADLRREFPRSALTDELSRALYATDASLYEFDPVAVVVPRNMDEVRRAVRLAHKHRVPILARGGGTSLAGQTANTALVI